MTPTWTEFKHGYRQVESYWQRGFDDGYACKHEELPSADGPHSPVNRGYMNGFRLGRMRFDCELMASLRGTA